MSADGFATLDELFGAGAGDIPQQPVDLPSGRRVLVRGMTRAELLINHRAAGGNALVIEQHNVASCMVAPVLTVDQVAQWQRSAAAGDLVPVVDTIRELSGLGEGAAKSGVSADGNNGS